MSRYIENIDESIKDYFNILERFKYILRTRSLSIYDYTSFFFK